MPVYRIPWKKNLRLQHQLYMKRWDLYEKPQRKKKSVIKRLLMTIYLLILFFVTAGVMPPEGDGILRLMVLFIALWVFYNFDRLRHSAGIWLALLLSVPAGWFRKSEEPEEEICFSGRRRFQTDGRTAFPCPTGLCWDIPGKGTGSD